MACSLPSFSIHGIFQAGVLEWVAIAFSVKEISPEYSLEGLMLKLELPILCPPDEKNRLTGKDPDSGKDWRWEEKRMTEDEMAGWHHWLNGHECEQAQRVGDGQGGLACCSPWGHKESDTTEWLNWTEPMWISWFWYLQDGYVRLGNSGGWGHSSGAYCPIFIFSCKNLNLF